MPLYEWLDRIEARPGMYLSRPGFDSLKPFIFGYEAALMANPVVEEDRLAWASFSEFVRIHMARPTSQTKEHFGDPTSRTSHTIFDGSEPTWETLIGNARLDDQG